MEAIFHPSTYDTIGTIEKGDGSYYFANVLDGSDNYIEIAGERIFRTKRAAIAWIKRRFKELNPTYNN